MRGRLAGWLLLAAWFGASAGSQPQAPVDLARGVVHERVRSGPEGGPSYALYLPTSWRPDRPAPVVFGFSPSGHGEEPVRLLAKAAEAQGWILVGSNDCRNGPLAPAIKAQAALWDEIHRRFRVEPGRVFAVGFSGGGRMAVRLAQAHPGQVAGVAAFGAFYADEGESLLGLEGTRCFLACGLEDFNFDELLHARGQLAGKGGTAWFETYPGAHHWPPETVAVRAVQFLATDPRGPLPFLAERRAEARRLEGAGEPLQALRLWVEIWARSGQEPPGARARLRQDPRTRRELDLESRYQDLRRNHFAVRTGPGWAASIQRIAKAAHGADPLEARLAWRILWDDLALLESQGWTALARGDGGEAETVFRSMAELAPRVARLRVLWACALVRQGRTEEGLTRLREAVALGYGPASLQAWAELAPLHGLPGWEALLAGPPSSAEAVVK